MTTANHWRYLVLRQLPGLEGNALHAAVVRLMPMVSLLSAYVEGENVAKVDGRMTLKNARAAVLDVLEPPEDEEMPDVI